MAKEKTTRFRNTTGGFVGAVKFKANGEEHAVAIEPHGTVELTDAEIEATARAPRNKTDNPFDPQPFEVIDPETGEVSETGQRPLLVEDTERRNAPTRGSRAAGEETGRKRAQPRRSRAAA